MSVRKNLRGSPQSEALCLEEFLPYRFSVLTNRISRHLAKAYEKQFGITIPEWRVIANLARFAPMTASDVADKSSMDKVKVSRAISRLLKSGLIERDTDEQDKRRGQLRLSKVGEDVFEEIAPLALGWEADLLAPLSADERRTLNGIMNKLQRVLDDAGA